MASAISAAAWAWSGREQAATRHHVGVTDGLDLLQAVPAGELVERREQLVQRLHDLRRADLPAPAGELHQVGEEHGDLGEAVGDPVPRRT